MASIAVTMKTKLKPLQEICFTHLLTTLEQYPVDVLALLPKAMRSEMLHNLPIVDVCRLEDTQFTAGIDMDAVWKELYRRYISPRLYRGSPTSWREALFSRMCQNILGDDRPFGRTRWLQQYGGCVRSRSVIHKQDLDSEEEHIDCVNYLVAANCVNEFTTHKNLVKERSERSMVRPSYMYVGAWRPQAKQLVPPRYTRFFPEGSCFLPDPVALDLIRKECRFSLKNVSISTLNFCEFLKYQKRDLGYLIDFLKDVNSLTISDEGFKIFRGPRIQKLAMSNRMGSPQHNSEAVTVKDEVKFNDVATSIEEVPSKILHLILSNASPKLASLRITDKITSSVAPLLTSVYSGLREFHFHGSTQLDIENLTSITEFQPMLHTISLSITGSRLVSRFDMTQEFAAQQFDKLLLSWIQTCLKKPSLVHFQLSLDNTTSRILFQVLVMYFSTPCSHEQTLTLSNISLQEVNFKNSCAGSESFLISDVPLPLDVEAPLQFDESYTLPYKCLVLNCCKLSFSFISSLVTLPPLKLKKLTVKSATDSLFSVSNQPGFDVQYLEVSTMRIMERATLDEFLRKKSLKELKLVACSYFIGPETIHRTASLRGFRVEEEASQNMRSKIITFTRQQ